MPIIHKTAAGKRTGSLTYVLSDATVDRYGDIIEPDGWQLDWFRKNPIALFNHNANAPIGTWRDVRVVDGQLLAELDPAERGTSARVDEILSLIEQDILRATSVGFRSIHDEPIDPKNPYRGTRFIEQELLETSVVSVPANPAALQVARSLHISDETMTLVFGGQAVTRQRDVATTGGQAATQRLSRADLPMNIAQQIQNTQERLNAARDALTELVRDNPEHDVDSATLFQNEIDALEQRLGSLTRTERALAARTAQQQPPEPGRRPLSMPAREIEPQELIWRAAAVHFVSRALQRPVEEVLRERYPDHEATAIITRAAVAGATTTQAGWAAELVQTAYADFLSNLLPTSVFPRLAALGVGLTFGPQAGTIKIPSRATTPSIGGSFVAEGAPIPVRRLGLTSISLLPHKVAGISVFSREIAMYSNPAIESIIREGISDDTAINIDGLLIDNVAESATRPKGLTNGVTPITASVAHGYTAILADLQALTAPFFAVNAGRKLAMLMNPAQGLQLMFAPGPTGVPFGWSTQFTDRFSVVESTSIPAGEVLVVDAADFVSVNGTAEFEVSEVATLHMEDTTPLNIGTAGAPATVAAPTQSMFQTAQIAIRMLANVTWAMRRTGMVQFMTGVNWGP